MDVELRDKVVTQKQKLPGFLHLFEYFITLIGLIENILIRSKFQILYRRDHFSSKDTLKMSNFFIRWAPFSRLLYQNVCTVFSKCPFKFSVSVS